MKKGSLQLGISTIVVLVIAMVLIAGGITFIRGFLGKGTDSLSQAFEITDFTIQPSAETPMVFAEGDKIDIRKGDQTVVKIGIYNKEVQPKYFRLKFADCTTQGQGINPLIKQMPTLTSLVHLVDSGEAKVFNVFVSATQGEGSKPIANANNGIEMDPGTYLCNIKTWTTDFDGTDRPGPPAGTGDEYTEDTNPYAVKDAVITIFT